MNRSILNRLILTIYLVLLPFFATLSLQVTATVIEANPIQFKHDLVQGAMVIGQVPLGSQLTINGRDIVVDEGGVFVFGLGRDAKANLRVSLQDKNGIRTDYSLSLIHI